MRQTVPVALSLALAAGALAAAPSCPPPPLRPSENVPPEWTSLAVQWQPTWDETVKTNDVNAWSRQLQADKSLAQAAGHIVWLRRVELFKALMERFPADTDRRIMAYREMAQACLHVGDRSRHNHYMRLLIDAFPDRALVAAEAYQQIMNNTPWNQPDAIPDGVAWFSYATNGLFSLCASGAIPDSHPAINTLWQNRYNLLLHEREYEAGRRFLDRYEGRRATDSWWVAQRAALFQAAGHYAQAADLYERMGNPGQAYNLRATLSRAGVDDFPRDSELEMRWEALQGAARLRGAQELAEPSAVQVILRLCAESGAFLPVQDATRMPLWAALDRALRGLEPAQLAKLRQAQDQEVQNVAAAAAQAGDFAEAMRLFRRYPWAASVLEALVGLAERELREGRHDCASRTFADIAEHADAPRLRLQAQVGLWLSLAADPAAGPALEQALAAVPDGASIGWRGDTVSAAALKRELRAAVAAPASEARRPLAALARRRIELPADDDWIGCRADTPNLSATWLDRWPVHGLDAYGDMLFVSGPGLAARYDAGSATARWVRAAGPPGLEADPEPRRVPGVPGPRWTQPARRPLRVRALGAADASRPERLFAMVDDGPDSGCREAIAAFDAATGALLWSTASRPEGRDLRPMSAPAASGGRVYLLAIPVSAPSVVPIFLVCLDAGDGSLLWRRRLGSSPLNPRQLELAREGSPVAVQDGSIFCSTDLGLVARCDVRDGAVEWVFTYPGVEQNGRLPVQFRRQGATPLRVGDRLILAPRDHSGFLALDCATGKMQWESALVPSDEVIGRSGNILVARRDRELAGIDLATGREAWVRSFAGDADAYAALAGPDVIVCAGDALCRVAAADGALVETSKLDRAIGHAFLPLPGGTLLELSCAPPAPVAAAPAAPPGPLRLPLVETWKLSANWPVVTLLSEEEPQDGFCVLAGRTLTLVKAKPAFGVGWRCNLPVAPIAANWAGGAILVTDGATLVVVDQAAGTVRWSYEPGFPVDLFQVDSRLAVAIQASREANVAVLDAVSGQLLWRKTFDEPARFGGQSLRWGRLSGSDPDSPSLLLYWNAALFAGEGWLPAELRVDARTGAVREPLRRFLPPETGWPREIGFGPLGVHYVDGQSRPHLLRYSDGADLLAGWQRTLDLSPNNRHPGAAGLTALGEGLCVRSLGELAAFDPAAKRETVFRLPRGSAAGRVCSALAIRAQGNQLLVISGERGRSPEYASGKTAVCADLFDRASGARVAGQELPGLACGDLLRAGYETQAAIRGDFVLVTARDGVHVFQSPAVPPAPSREVVLPRLDAPIVLDGSRADWQGQSSATLADESGGAGTLQVAHDGRRVLLALTYPDRHRSPFRARGAFAPGDRVAIGLTSAAGRRRWVVGADALGRAVAQDESGEPATNVAAACAFQPDGTGTTYEIAVPLPGLENASDDGRRVGVRAAVLDGEYGAERRAPAWSADGGDGALRPILLRPYSLRAEPAVREIVKAAGRPATARLAAERSAPPAKAAAEGRFLSQWVYVVPGARPVAAAVGLYGGGSWRFASLHETTPAQAPPAAWPGRQFLPWWAGRLPDEGQWFELRVPLEVLGLHDRAIEGVAFRQDSPGRVIWDRTALVFPGGERVLVDDPPPAGEASPGWKWTSDLKQSGASAHESAAQLRNGEAAVYSVRLAASAAEHVAAPFRRAVLSQWVYLDPARPPAGLALQLHDGRAWRERLAWGAAGPGRPLGRLPAPGQWQELSVPLDATALASEPIAGIAFDQADGRVLWGRTSLVVDGRAGELVADSVPPARRAKAGGWRPGGAQFAGEVHPVPGKVGCGARFDGQASALILPDSPALNTPHMTAEAWVRLDPGAEPQWIFSRNDDAEASPGYDLTVEQGRLVARVVAGDPAQVLRAESGPGAVPPGEWHHVAMTWDGVALCAYVDGKAVEPRVGANAAGALAARRMGPSPFFIGRRSAIAGPTPGGAAGSGSLRGVVDEARLYSRALSPLAIRRLCAEPGRKLPRHLRQALVAAWAFDDAAAPADPAAEWQWVTHEGRRAHTLRDGATGSVHYVAGLVTPATGHIPCERGAALAALEKYLPDLGATEDAWQMLDLALRLEGGTAEQRAARYTGFLKSFPGHPRSAEALAGLRDELAAAGNPAPDAAAAVAASGGFSAPAASGPAPRAGAAVRAWQILGGWHNDPDGRNGFNQLVEPEQKPFDVQGLYPVWPPEGGLSRWRVLRSDSDYMDLRGESSYHESVVLLAAAWVYSGEERRVRLAVGCDSSIDVRVNRRLVLSAQSRPAAVPGDSQAEVLLPAGWSELMLKVGQGRSRSFGFFFEITDPVTGEPVDDLCFSLLPPQG